MQWTFGAGIGDKSQEFQVAWRLVEGSPLEKWAFLGISCPIQFFLVIFQIGIGCKMRLICE